MFINRNPSYFLTIAREQNVTRAAEKLFISQSSLSQHIARLEQELGVRLLDRSQNPLVLTPAGKIYQRYLESESFLYSKLMDDLSSSRSQTISIGLGTWRGSILLPDILPDFLAAHPNAQVDLHEYPVSELLSQLADSRIDVALMNTTPAMMPADLVAETVVQERIFLIVARENLLAPELERMAAAGSFDLRILTGQRYIALNANQTVGRHVENFFQKKKLLFPNRLVTTNNRTALNLTARNIGFCFMVEQGLAEIRGRDELLAFDLNDPELALPLSLIYKASSYRSPICQDLVERIQSYYLALQKKSNALLGTDKEET